MATYYILLDNSYTSISHAGNTSDPWSFEDLDNYIAGTPVNGDIFKLRGRRTDDSFIYYSGTNILNFVGWDSTLYGPWQLNVQKSNGKINYSDGILNFVNNSYYRGNPVSDSDISFLNLTNMYVISSEYKKAFTNYGTQISNTVIDQPYFAIGMGAYTLLIENSIITNSATIFNGNYGYNFSATNVITPKLTSAGLIDSLPTSTLTNITYGWNPPNILPTKDSPIGQFCLSVSGDYGPDWANDYELGLWGEDRYNVGAFYFDEISLSGVGHIGSFYLGPINQEIYSDIMEVSAILLQPKNVSIVNPVSANVNVPSFNLTFKLLQPTIYSISDIDVSFIGVPRVGSSPLTVDFTGIVKFIPQMASIYKVKEYIWCFDYDFVNNINNTDWITTTQNTISHVYVGYRGQKFSVSLLVTLELL